MIVQQDWSVGHGAESNGWDSNLPEVSGVCTSREYLRPHTEAVLGEGFLQGRVPGIRVTHRGQGLVCELTEELQLNIRPGLGQPASDLRLELVDVGGRGDPHVVDGEDPAKPLRLDLLQSPCCLSGCRRERVERPE